MKVFTDAARGTEVIGLGYYISHDRYSYSGRRSLQGTYTSMEAEYYALIEGVRIASYEQRDDIEVFCDCKPLVAKMDEPDYNDETWRTRRKGCHWLLDKFSSWELEWVPRERNENANEEASIALEEGRYQSCRARTCGEQAKDLSQ